MDPRPGRLQQVIAIAISLAMAWYMLPEWQRKMVAMRAAAALRAAAGRAAHREGQAGMGDELGGRYGDAERRYSAAYQFSRARDAFGRVLESMRP